METNDEAIAFINKLSSSSVTPSSTSDVSGLTQTIPKPTSSETDVIDLPLPPDEEVMEYITSKPHFAHSTFEIHEKFFGRRFSSRDEQTKRMYHRIHRQLTKIREKIEKQFEGKWKSTIKDGGVKEYTFRRKIDM